MIKRSLVVGIPAIAALLFGAYALRGSRSISHSQVRPLRPGMEAPSADPIVRPAFERNRPTPEGPGAPGAKDVSALLGIVDPARLKDLSVDVRRFLTLAKDPAMRPALQSLLDAWRADPNPDVRLRAEIFRVYLEGTWEDLARSHSDSKVRAALLENPPDGGSVTSEYLLAALEYDPDAAARLSAVRGLPTDLDAGRTRRLASWLGVETDGAVRRQAIGLLGTLRTDEPTAIQALKRCAFSSPCVRERQAALPALLQCSNDHPGLLTPEEVAAVERAIMRVLD